MKLRPAILLFAAIFFAAVPARPQGVVWSGAPITFFNAPGSNWQQTNNADLLTANVWLTRSTTKGLFNYFDGGYNASSPGGTEWALGTLANRATLTYADWTTCYGGPGNLATTITSTNAVVHLITDDIYLSVRFTYWGGSGGGFAYERSTPLATPEPAVNLILLGGTLFFLAAKKIRRG